MEQQHPSQIDTDRNRVDNHFKFRGEIEWTGGPAPGGMMEMNETMSHSMQSEQTYDPSGLPVG